MRKVWQFALAGVVATAGASVSGGQLAPVANQARASAATLTLSGQVVDDRTGRAIAGAAVTIAGRAGLPDPPTLIADRNGRFSFNRLPPAQFTLTATALGYLAPSDHSEGMPPVSVPADLTAGASRTDITMRLVKPATLSGMVRDEANEPVEGVQLGVFREHYVAGFPRLQVASAGGSNDRGQFRFERLSPGRYVVCGIAERVTLPGSWHARFERLSSASPAERATLDDEARRSLTALGFGATFRVGEFLIRPGTIAMGPVVVSDDGVWSAPNTCNGNTSSPAQAPRLVLASGDDHVGVDLHAELQPATRVAGHVYGPNGPLAWQGLRLEAEGWEALGWAEGVETASTMSDSSGAFAFLGVPQGTYIVKAFNIPQPARGAPPTALPDGDTLAARQMIVVGKEAVTDLGVNLVRSSRISGRVTFSGASAPPSEAELGKVGISVLPADGVYFRFSWSRPLVVMSPDGSFRSTGLIPGRYVMNVSPLGPWQLESALLNGIDVSDQPFDASGDDIADVVITMTDQPSALSGTVRDDQGLPVDGGRVVVFPTIRTRWVGQGENPRRQRAAVTSPSGLYSLKGLPPGEYFVVALGARDTVAWQTPDAFARFSQVAQKITLAAREIRTLDVKVGGR